MAEFLFRRRLAARLAVSCLLAFSLCRAATAEETLADVLETARRLHPRVAAARSLAQAMAEGVPQARAGWLPKITATADAGMLTDPRAPSWSSPTSTHSSGFGLSVSQTIFDSGRTSSAVGNASATAAAQRESARLAEQQLFLEVATTYLDVRHGRRLAAITRRSIELLSATRDATRLGARAREATAADLAQSEAAVAGADARLAAVEANLAASEQAFAAAVQHPPGALAAPPPVEAHLPASANAAVAEAQRASPAVTIALHRQIAARYAADRARAELLPTIGLEAGIQRRYGTPATPDQPDGLTVRAVASMPLYTGGAGTAAIRQADFNHAAARYQVADARLQARSAVAQAWSRLVAGRAARRAYRTQLEANTRAFAAVAAEQRVGQRTILDVINAQQSVLTAGTSLAESERDLVLAACSILALVGRLDPELMAAHAASGPSWQTSVRSGSRGERDLAKVSH